MQLCYIFGGQESRMIEGLEFDDVLIVPTLSEVCSRDDVDISVKLSDNFTLNFPLIASPMVGVTDGKFAKQLSDLGGIAILHRFYKTKEFFYADVKENLTESDNYGLSIKVGDSSYKEYLNGVFAPKILLVDTANGYLKTVLDYCEKLKSYIVKNNLNILLMAGNVVTEAGCVNLNNSGCDLIRVGIGGGSPCSTRNKTGIGIPAITAIQDCQSDDYKIVVDGGITASGDLVKAVVAGADLGMAGRLFAETFEAPNDGVLYGMASRTNMENVNMPIKSVEGFDIQINKHHHLADFVKEFGYGIKSAGTYLNARSLEEIYFNGEFIRVTDYAIKKNI